jgi:hypothetical protein
MKVALIPPTRYLDMIQCRAVQMILPACLKSPRYRDAYHPMRLANSYVIMDNGMFENDQMSFENLIELIEKWRPDEVIFPDVEGDMKATLDKSDAFLNVFESIRFPNRPTPQIVVQVAEQKEIPQFIDSALQLEDEMYGVPTFTFGIPRRLVEKFGPFVRKNIVDFLQEMAPHNEIHLLGYPRNADNPDTFNEVKTLAAHVRSIDTSAPYVWANANATMSNPTPFDRLNDYFGTIGLDDDLVKANIATLDRWASGRD